MVSSVRSSIDYFKVVNYHFKNTEEMGTLEFAENKKEYLRNIGEQMGMKIYDGEVVRRNSPYMNIEALIPLWRGKIPDVSFVVDEIHTLVETPKGYYLKIQPYISIHLPDNSLIRFSPYKDDGLEISRIQSAQMGSGSGSILMELFLGMVRVILGYVPLIWLECTGSVGIGQTYVNSGISEQTKFFRKFGFRVNDRSKYPNWVDMVRQPELS